MEHIPSCVAVATIAAPAELSHIRNALGSALDAIEREGVAEVNLAGRTFKITKQFVDDLEQTRMEQSIRNLKRALLVLHSPTDEIVGIENAFQIFEKAAYPQGFILSSKDYKGDNKGKTPFPSLDLGIFEFVPAGWTANRPKTRYLFPSAETSRFMRERTKHGSCFRPAMVAAPH